MVYKSKSKFVSSLLVVAILFSLLTPFGSKVHASIADNVFSNSDFEKGNLNNWGTYNLSNTTVNVQNLVKHSGNSSFEANFNGDAKMHIYQDGVGVPGQLYYYELWANTEGITPLGQTNAFYPGAVIQTWNGNSFVNNNVFINLPPKNGWTKFSGTFTTATTVNSIKINLNRFGTGNITGKMYFDDILIARMPNSIQLPEDGGTYNVTDAVTLGNQMNLTGTYEGTTFPIAASSAVTWQVVSGEAAIENNVLKYTGVSGGGTVTLKANYAGLEATTSLSFIRETITPSPNNLLLNSGFEFGNYSNWGVYASQNTTLNVQNIVKRSENSSLEATMNGDVILNLYQDVPALPGKTYYYEQWVKMEGVTPTGEPANFYPSSIVAVWNNDAFVDNKLYRPYSPNSEWVKYSGTLTIPQGANKMKLNIGRYGPGNITGKMYLDDAYLARVPESLQFTAVNVSYPNNETIDLATQINTTGNFGGWVLPISAADIITWQVVSGSAVLENNKLKYTGTSGDVTLKGTYAGREANVTLSFAADTQAPQWASNAQLNQTEKGRSYMDLAWSGATDNWAVTQYRISMDAQPSVLIVGAAKYTVTGLEAGRTYHFEIEAGDASGNWSSTKLTADLSTSTLQEPDWNNASLLASNLEYSSLMLNWVGASDDMNVTQYKIYKNGQELAVTQNTNSYPITGLTAETSYTFRVQAGDADGNWTNNGPTLTVVTPYRAIAEAMVVVNESTKIDIASRNKLGFSHDMAESQSVLMANTTTTDLKSDYFTLMQDLPLPLNRGGVGQDYLWKKTLGTMAERTGFPNQWYPATPMNFGIIEWLKSVQGVTPDATFVWGFNMKQADYAADAADLAEFLTGDGTTNPNGGTNWAQRRIDLGVVNPVKVKYELGNELDNATGSNIDAYIQQSREIIAAVRQVDPTAKFAAFAKTAPWSAAGTNDGSPTGGWRDWHNKILQQLGNDIDYIAFHPYYLGYSLAYVDKYIDSIRDDIAAWETSTGNVDPTHKVKIYISEHGVWPLRDETDNFNTAGHRTHDLEGSLGSAEFIIRMSHRPEVELVSIHSFTSGPWYAINKNSAGKLYLSGIGEMMKVMNQSLGKDVVKSTVTGDYTDLKMNDTSFAVSAMTTETAGLNVVLVNRDPRMKRDVSFQFEQKYKLVKKTVLTGDSILSDNNTSNPINLTTETVNDESQFNHIVIPDKSLVVLYLELKDITSPVTTDNAPINWINHDVTVNLVATDNVNGSGVAATYFTVDGGPQQSGTTVAFTTEGIHTLEYWSIDNASNTESKHTVLVKIDKTAPVSSGVINPATPNGSSGWYTSNVVVSLAATDNLSSVTSTVYSINNGAWNNYSGPLDFSDGVYKVDFRSTDQAGNIEQSQSIMFNVDKTAPNLNVTLDKTVLWPPNGKMVTIHAALTPSDATSGVASVILTSITSNATEEEHEQDHKKDHKKSEDIQADIGTMATSFSLRAEKAEHGNERIYTITYTVTDLAGNKYNAISTVSVPANGNE